MKTAHLNALRAVEAVAREGSLRRAAASLGVTAAAVGQQVRAFEDVVGRPLFARTPGGLTPLPALADALPRLTGAMTTLSEVLSDLSGRTRADRISLSATPALADDWLPDILPRLPDRVGHAELLFDTTLNLVDLTSGDFDFAIRHCATVPSGLSHVPLFTDLMVPVATPEFALRHALTSETRTLVGVPLCHVAPPGAESVWLEWSDWSRETGVAIDTDARDALRFTAHASGFRAAKSGLALKLVGLVEAMPDLRQGRMVLPLGPLSAVISDRVGYRLVWSSGHRLSPIQRRFRAFLSEEASRLHTEMEAHLGRDIPRLA